MKNILYIYPHPMKSIYHEVINKNAPTDRMYGLIELKKLGYDVKFSDKRFQGLFGRLRSYIKTFTGIALFDLKTYLSLYKYDVVVVKDTFSTSLSLACRLQKTKVIYMDALFRLPRDPFRKLIAKFNIALSKHVIVYSTYQLTLCSKFFELEPSYFKFMPYAIDTQFYRRVSNERLNCATPYILTVGRDLGRDFKTLVDSMEGLGVNLKIVTLPYLLRDIDISKPWIEVLQNISYDKLFSMYAGALFIVLPLKSGLTYPSGIRGLLEALALNKAVVASYSSVLEEYFQNTNGVLFVKPENSDDLSDKMKFLLTDTSQRKLLEIKGSSIVTSKYDIGIFNNHLHNFLISILD